MKNFAIYGLLAIEFLSDDDENDRGIKTIRHKAVGELKAENQTEAKHKAEVHMRNFIDENYPVRWNSEIVSLEVVEY